MAGGEAGGRPRLEQRAPLILLAVAIAAAAVLLVVYGSELTFFQDSWEYLMNRRGFSAAAVFDPHNEHIVVIPVLIEQALLHSFGMSSMLPESVVLVALLLATVALLFVYVRRRLGPWPALFAALLLLFFGPGWQDLLWPFQIGFAGGAMCGIATLLALENDSERWDLAACGLLALSIAFSSLGLAFAAAAAVDVWQRRRERGRRRAYVVLVPLVLYALWYLGWGHTAVNNLSAHNVLVSPRYVGEGVVATLDSLLALGTISGEVVGRSQWGLPLTIALLALLGYGQLKRPGFYPRLWPILAAAAVYWFLAAFNQTVGREPFSSRYLYIDALFLLLIAANLLRGVRFNRWGLLAAAAVTLVAVGFNLTPLREGRDFFKGETVLTRADLGAIEIAAETIEPSFGLPPEISGSVFLNEITAGEYLRAVEEFGSPAYTPAELAAAPEAGRRQADVVLANALPLGIETESRPTPPGDEAACRRVAPGGAGKPLPLRPGTTTIDLAAGGEGTIRLRRFAHRYPLVEEGVPGGSTTRLVVPADRSSRRWLLLVEADRAARVCS